MDIVAGEIHKYERYGYDEHVAYYTHLKSSLVKLLEQITGIKQEKEEEIDVRTVADTVKTDEYFNKIDSELFKCSLAGLSVKVGNSYIVYDPEKGVSDVTEFTFNIGDVYKIPTTQLAAGDIILLANNTPAYVINVERENQETGVKIYNYLESTVDTYIPVKNVLGLQITAKIMTLFDIVKNQACCGTAENNPINGLLLPLLLLKGDKGGDDIKDFLMLSMLSGNNLGLNGPENALPLLLLKSDKEEDNIKDFLMLSMLSGNKPGFNGFENMLPLLLK